MSVLRFTLIGLMTAVFFCCCTTRQKHESVEKSGTAAKPAETPPASSTDTPPATTTPAATPPPAEPSPVPENFSCRVGQGGGITGLWTGFTLEPGGAVLSWEGKIAGEGAEPAGHLSPEDVARLWRLVEEKKFMTLESDVRGNMTYFLEVTAGVHRHAAYWTDMMGKTPDPALSELRLAFLDALSKAAPHK